MTPDEKESRRYAAGRDILAATLSNPKLAEYLIDRAEKSEAEDKNFELEKEFSRFAGSILEVWEDSYYKMWEIFHKDKDVEKATRGAVPFFQGTFNQKESKDLSAAFHKPEHKAEYDRMMDIAFRIIEENHPGLSDTERMNCFMSTPLRDLFAKHPKEKEEMCAIIKGVVQAENPELRDIHIIAGDTGFYMTTSETKQ
jgi:hypothetical protein